MNVLSQYGGGQTETGKVFVPAGTEAFTHDADGNLTGDGRWTYSWDAENRLVQMIRDTDSPAGARQKLVFEYDHQGRRIRKQFFTYSGGWQEQTDTIFLYDGWNLVAELNASASNARVRTYVWGSDLSGSMQGAGGVGGLLKLTYYGTSTTNAFVAYDGNGNVTALIDAANGNVCARYEYGPFAEPIRSSGPLSKPNPIRFSTKYTDTESGFLYYGYRYYNPSTGRWPSRDPLGELGGLNLYGFVYNDPAENLDTDGLRIHITCPKCGRPRPAGYDCPWCGGSGPPPFPTTVDAVLLFTVSCCVPLDEAGIAPAAGWKFLGAGVKKVGQCCCKLLSKVIRTKSKIDANKLRHIFDKAEHNLDDLLKEFGGDQTEAYQAIEQATRAAKKGCGPGTFEIQITVKGQTITARGTVLPDGTVKIGTVFK